MARQLHKGAQPQKALMWELKGMENVEGVVLKHGIADSMGTK